MASDRISRIRVGSGTAGIVGLQDALEEIAARQPEPPENQIAAELLVRLSKCNYIPAAARESYAQAFLREFRKHMGLPVEEAGAAIVEVKVLGQGCVQCDGLEHELMGVMAELNLRADIEHVREVKAIASYGVMGTPALLINGQVKCVGSVPARNKLIEWLTEAGRQHPEGGVENGD